ncbi:hypothetical protein QZH41_018704 [Actinostola sp. cb2023]|nr:hypothetical protein QZH41_018704 [Actinostola sp. cb2023]
MDEFINMYNGQNWTDSSGKLFKHKVLISRIQVRNGSSVIDKQAENAYQTRQEQQHTKRTIEEFVHSDLRKLPELNPPPIMPNGNVGTPLTVFIGLIRACKFPPHLIKKLGLTFPRSKRKKYGNVPFDYEILEYGNIINVIDDDDDDDCDDNMVSERNNSTHREDTLFQGTERSRCESSRKLTSSKAKTQSESIADKNTCEFPNQATDSSANGNSSSESNPTKKCKRKKTCDNENDRHDDITDDDITDDDITDNELEEWDRHASLHNDITSQERSKERLYEDNIELKWEKGGSGLVWYTDAAFWKQQEEADFDEETVDDWDVDMSIYDEEGAGDLDAKTLLQLRVEREWKRGQNIDLNRVGSFEKHTRGFGGKLMRKHGWTEGQSLGSSQVGITEPIPSDGQKPSSKRGLGFYGEKLNRFVKRPRPMREAVISTIYDKKEDRNVGLFQSEGPYNIKYRDKVDFVPGTASK